ncbi:MULTISPECIES: TonB-dependent receptor domain-containing protein [Sphingopyxis]|uniref:Outer membrane receptor protein involved in Fe transport n=1 Tax=Sphingopyxis panaciterrulae TaxID=462372 RepID=A0A7W9B938_9SPHN|nr:MULTISPECIES: TonB-dependent receptor [Sphingopyxis]MBB5708453.1 outer membrane receptor protein involved in Fe transport [Sphingopyxis panaciterrulae]HEX2813642.1 TonB-dependent receptor [Sphingopyxis sp.]
MRGIFEFNGARTMANAGASVAAIVAVAIASPAMAQERDFNVPAQDAARAIPEFARQAGIQIVASGVTTRGKTTNAVRGSMSVSEGLRVLLAGTGLVARGDPANSAVITVVAASEGQSAASQQGDYVANEIVVTAQKRVESIQDVPIAITALSQKNLEEQKIESGADIMRAVPNLTFSKSNFTGYNISIRGIGTKAISATSDPGVAVSFNNVGIIHNRFFEQEFFDMERLEVLRGPQGTLYGRNATGGVINLITAKPKLNKFEGSIKGEVGNYDSRRMVGMLNIPIVPDSFGLRIAGSMTDRDGYDYNSVTKNRVNGRDLYSLRATLGFENDWLRGNFIWERFREDDNRSRTGKQLCHRDDSPETIGSTSVIGSDNGVERWHGARAALFSTGCKAGSLYDDNAFGTPNGLALAYVSGVNVANSIFVQGYENLGDRTGATLLNLKDPYGGMMQSRDLREIASFQDPIYRAKSDLLELNLDADLTDGITLSSQTAWNWDGVYSFQDYNRYNTLPIFNDTSGWLENPLTGGPSPMRSLAPGGIFCDPQIGCSDTLGVFDISSADSKQFAQEVRLQSSFSGPFNFSIGGNYTKFRTQNDYYVMSNLLTALARMAPLNNTATIGECGVIPAVAVDGLDYCPYIDPNPVESIDGEGHNYFRSSNPYKLESWAAFGEAYYNINPDLKLTAGLRYTRDRKTFTPVPSQLLLAPTLFAGGTVGRGYPAEPDIKLNWGEFTGRAGIDWQPDLGFTDQTLVYAFYSRGYKAGGMNPPTPGFATVQQWIDAGILPEAIANLYEQLGALPVLELTAVNYGPTFEPEFVNAFEIGTKNVLMGGRLTLNAAAFFYDYKNYQVSQIRDRTAINENFDAKVWGAELSAQFEPVDRLRINANIGWLGSRIGKGEQSIDPMNRTLGNPNYTVIKPWVQMPSNCVVPTQFAESWLQTNSEVQQYWKMCGGYGSILALGGRTLPDPATGLPFDFANYPELNGGAGLYTELGGKELPNSPHWTVNLGAEYTIPFGTDWSATIRGDGYWQGKSWARVYNLNPYDRLRDWTNFNISLRVDGPDDLSIEAYVKNVFNSTPITDAFLNSDDSGLTTNVFTLDPRIIGFSIAKKF